VPGQGFRGQVLPLADNAELCSAHYELDMALHNEGLEDARLIASRAEVARWVYTHFTEESALNLGNFRGYEA
jgi:hypothetical protein